MSLRRFIVVALSVAGALLKVTVVALGKVDLHTEELTINFNTRPREGVGISAGMFTNPFIELAGTLASPRLGVSAKGAAAGVAAAATGRRDRAGARLLGSIARREGPLQPGAHRGRRGSEVTLSPRRAATRARECAPRST